MKCTKFIMLVMVLALTYRVGQASAEEPQAEETQAEETGQKSEKKKTEMTAQEIYEKGLKAMRRGYYTKALEYFNKVRNYHRDEPVSVLAELAIADLYFKKGDFEASRLGYDDFARLHPRHKDLDYVNYQLGMCFYERAPHYAGRDQKMTKKSVNVWSGFEARHPESTYVPEVRELLQTSRDRLAAKELLIAEFYADKGSWFAARKRLQRMLTRYPNSSHRPAALALLGVSLHQWGLTTEAQNTRETLNGESPNSKHLAKLDRALAQPAGTPPVEETFIRPYRFPALNQMQ